MATIYACTGERFARLEGEPGDWTVEDSLAGSGAQCLAVDPADPRRVLVGTRGSGAFLSADGGGSWSGCELPEDEIFSVAISPADGRIYAGSEPSRLFVSDDGQDWRELTALQQIPSRDEWSFPPRPWTSHVRWIAPDPHDGERLLVGIELGGLMLSGDGGASFSDHREGAVRDVHSVIWHPSEPGHAYEAGGRGTARSRDGGEGWEPADEGRDLRYCWAVAADPTDPERWYVSAAPGPGEAHGDQPAQARLYRREGEDPWKPLDGGLPEPLEGMPYALIADGERLWCGLSDGELWLGADRGESWSSAGRPLESIVALAVAPG